jgi:hypothetical protein
MSHRVNQNLKQLGRYGRAERAIVVATLLFVCWAVAFIARASFVAVDGLRRYSLFDDAMISMRYAWNLAHGNGLVWNAGERVEGYTNTLMTLLMALAALSGDKSLAVLLVQGLGILVLLAVAWLNARLAHAVAPPAAHADGAPLRAIVFVATLAYYPLTFWTLMGMETGLLALLLCASLLAAFAYADSGRPAALPAAGLCLGLLYLTRNDSAIFALLIWAYLAFELLRPPRRLAQDWPWLVLALGLFGACVVGLALFRLGYYGQVLPNTYTLKLAGVPLAIRLSDGLSFIGPFLLSIGLLALGILAGIALRCSAKHGLLLSMLLAAIGYQIYVGGDPWAYWRMLAPAMPLALALFILSLYILLRPNAARARWAAIWGLTLLGLAGANYQFLPELALLKRPFTAPENEANVNTALLLDRLTTPEASVGVIWAGALPYYLDRRAIDFLGKSDATIARLPPDLSGAVSWSGMRHVPGHIKYNLDYSIKQLRPTYVEALHWGNQNVSAWAEGHYTRVRYGEIELILLAGSPAVRWELLADP